MDDWADSFDSDGKYPEHDKLKGTGPARRIIGDFLETTGLHHRQYKVLDGYKAEITESPDGEEDGVEIEVIVPHSETINLVLARYFGVDYQKFQDEQEEMFRELQEANRVDRP